MGITFINTKTGEKIFVDSDDFETFDKLFSDENWDVDFSSEFGEEH